MKRLILIIFALLLIITGCSSNTKKENTPVIEATDAGISTNTFNIAGSGSNIPITQELLNEYAKEFGINTLLPVSIGSSGAIKALQAKDIDIGLISRPLNEHEKKSGLKQKKYARIGIVFGVHIGVPDDNIQTSELINIYSGSKNTWSNGENIIVLIREEGDSSNTVLSEKIPGFRKVLEESLDSKRWEILYTDAEETEAIMNTQNAIGITDTTVLDSGGSTIKPLKFNGVDPTLDNISNQSYPLYKDLYFAYREPLIDEAGKFMDFVYSRKGREVINNHGGIALKEE